MGAWEHRSRRLRKLGLAVVVLHLLLGSGAATLVRVNGNNHYSPSDLDGLQALWAAWNTSTPNLSTNLAGWSSTQVYPCESLSNPDNTIPNWQGVNCFMTNSNATDSADVNFWVSSLSLDAASIVGTLPQEIGKIASLTTLELRFNPNLTGPLPDTLGNMSLNTLDLSSNAFTGPIPASMHDLWNLLKLDLSGNQLTGGYPWNQTSRMHYLQVLGIGDNNFTGEIPADVFQNKTELRALGISNNKFSGPLPNLTYMHKYLNYMDVSGNQFEGPLPNLTMFESLQYVDLSRNKFTGTVILQEILNLSNPLKSVDLSCNQLTGYLQTWNFSGLRNLEFLDLTNNSFSGTLDISQMHALGILQLKNKTATDNSISNLFYMGLINNSIQNVISDSFVIANVSTIIQLQGNPYCDNYNPKDDAQRCYCTTQTCSVTATSLQSDQRKVAIIASVCSTVAVVLILLVVVGAILYKNRRYRQYLQLQLEKKFEEFDVKPTIFHYNDLRAATRDFHEDMKLGQGGYGAVYKGMLPNGNVVAVKQLYIKNMHIGMDEFLNEVVLITGMKHRNLVNLKGCCLRENQRLLVYEYVDNFDVDQILLGSRKEAVIWGVRLKMCLGIARGLHYLHALAQPRVIHRDIKAGNVLLDRNMEPKIADFGLALLFPDDRTHIMTVHVAGTKGYLAPEYATLGQLSDKVDVYSFGVLCLEIISGRRNIDETLPLDKIYLSQWSWQLHEEDRLLELVDPSLQLTDEEARNAQRVIKVCLLCLQVAAEKRPTMTRVLHILEGDNESDVEVLQNVGRGERPSLEAIMSSKPVHYKSSGLESVMEEGMTSNASDGNSLLAQDSLSIGVAHLREIVAR